jgi:TolB-like protein/DNA-binding winged helix-turn-helix (wHTH) protein/Tfp pilus assembly protein PilF
MQSGHWHFGPFELDCSRYELLRDGRPVRIERIPMELLILLVSRDGQLVDRKEIVKSIWVPGVHVDSEQGINTAVRKLRQILGDDPERPKFVQTVVGKGYRFVGAITRPQEASPEPVSEAIPSIEAPAAILVPHPQTPRLRMLWIALLVAVLVMALTGSWLYSRYGSAPVVLAVLPFENLTGVPDQEYLADGITDETISLLGNLDPSQLRVIARTSVMQYKGARKQASQVGRELGVGLVVEGSLREENGRVRITTQLIRVRDQKRLWTNTDKEDVNPVLTMQTKMASAIAEDLRLHLSPGFQVRIERARHINSDAHNDYFLGLHFWNLRDEASLEKAIDYFQRAIDRVQDYAEAYAGLADAHSLLAYGNYRAPRDAFGSARLAAEKALQLDSSAAEPHASLGYIKLYSDWDTATAESQLKEALRLNFNYAQAHDWLGYVLTARGSFQAANDEFREALKLDPKSLPIRTDLGFELHYSGDQLGAVRALDDALELNSHFALAHFWRGRVYGAMGQCEKALTDLDASEPALRDWQPLMAAKGHFLGKCGHPSQAQAVLARFAELSNTRYVTSYGVALVHAGLGQNDEALNALDRAVQERSHWLVWLRLDPRFSAIRDSPHFQNLLTLVGLTK